MNKAPALNQTFNTVTAGDLYYLDGKGNEVSVKTALDSKRHQFFSTTTFVNRVDPSIAGTLKVLLILVGVHTT